ncbi:hypothetical protein HKX48_008023 [Thoreauomyces humboldtii]|nr:hypothetical protein HKX48_008023 [Thoreauomyces humboldtii]
MTERYRREPRSLRLLLLGILVALVPSVVSLSSPVNFVGYGWAGQPQFRATEAPDLTLYGDLHTLAYPGNGRYQFGSYLEDENNLRMYWALSDVTMGMPWMGIGFGATMLGADFIVSHLYPNLTVQIHEHTPRNQYAPPYAVWHPEPWVMTPLNGGYVNGTFFVEVRRPVIPQPSCCYTHATLASGRDGSEQNMIWAYNLASIKNHWHGYFSYHHANPGSQTGLPTEANQTHGAMAINYAENTVRFISIPKPVRRVAHGSGMFTAWLVLFPGGAYYSRYMRFTPRWIWVHVILQVTGVCLAIASLVTIVVSIDRFRVHAHSVLGVTMLSLLTLQLLMGLTNRSLLRTELPATRRRRTVKLVHRIIGYFLLLASIAQAALGLYILYPMDDGGGVQFWIVYFFMVGFWVLLFSLTEFTRRYFFVIKKTGVPSMDESGDAKAVLTGKSVGVLELTKRQDRRRYPDLKAYTWKSLDEAVVHGKLLVVADGRYVYDVSKWIFSHPGGQLILLAVAGTDVSSDYFHEAGYDAEDFTPPPLFPPQNGRRQRASQFHEPEPVPSSSQISVVSEGTINLASLVLTQADWYRIHKARRTHVHSKLAIMRLSSLLVGEITSPEKSISDGDTACHLTDRQFDRYEYRRYGLTQRELLTRVTDGVSVPIWRLRFCLLYPYETREGQQEEFQPGQSVEIQVRVHGVPSSRYYTPVSGNLTAFDIWVKQHPEGVSSFLCTERPGDRQFKIRGSFGESLVSPLLTMIPTSGGGHAPAIRGSIVFVAGGTGITPFLQLLQHLFLPTGVPLRAASNYEPLMPDELKITKGDSLVVRHHYLDGWALGFNAKTDEEGVFPLPKTYPRFGTRFKLVLVNCINTPGEMVGSEMMDAVLLAYPHQFEVHHVVKSGVEDGRGNFSGFGYEGQISESIIKEAVDGAAVVTVQAEVGDAQSPAASEYVAGKIRKAIVCGPPDFNELVQGEVRYRIVVSVCVSVRDASRLPVLHQLSRNFGYSEKDIKVLSSTDPDAE